MLLEKNAAARSAVLVLVLMAAAGLARAESSPVLLPEIGIGQLALHRHLLLLCAAIALSVFLLKLLALLRHRRARRGQAEFHKSTWAELLWMLIPALLLVAMAFPAARDLFRAPPAAGLPSTFLSRDEAVHLGGKIHEAYCAACHQRDGAGLPPMYPALKGSLLLADEARWQEHVVLVLKGRSAMPAWRDKLDDRELAAVVSFQRQQWGRPDARLVQPGEVALLRHGL